MDKNDIAISSRITDFNVQISAVNIHSHCSQMFGQNNKFNLSLLFFMIIILKNNLWSFKLKPRLHETVLLCATKSCMTRSFRMKFTEPVA